MYSEIDKPIRNFIVMLNKIEGVKTFSSCSGHETKEKSFEIHINIEYNESKNLPNTWEINA